MLILKVQHQSKQSLAPLLFCLLMLLQKSLNIMDTRRTGLATLIPKEGNQLTKPSRFAQNRLCHFSAFASRCDIILFRGTGLATLILKGRHQSKQSLAPLLFCLLMLKQASLKRFRKQKSLFDIVKKALLALVGKTGFEPATPWSQTRCATGLRYFPIDCHHFTDDNPIWDCKYTGFPPYLRCNFFYSG